MSGPLYEEFDFDTWLEQNELVSIKDVFEEHNMDDSDNLSLSNPKMGIFLADKRVTPYLTKVFTALQNITQYIPDKNQTNTDDLTLNSSMNNIENKRDTNNIDEDSNIDNNSIQNNNIRTPTTLIISNEENQVMQTFKNSLKKINAIDKIINELKKEYKLSKNKQEINYKIQIDKSKQNVKKIFKNIRLLINEKETQYINKLNKLYSEQTYDDFKEICLNYSNLKKVEKMNIEGNIKQCHEMFKTVKPFHSSKKQKKHTKSEEGDMDSIFGHNHTQRSDDESIESSLSIDHDELLFDFDNEDRKSKIIDIGTKQQKNFNIQYDKMKQCKRKLEILVERYKIAKNCQFIMSHEFMNELSNTITNNLSIKNDGQFHRYSTQWSTQFKGKDIILSENNCKGYLNGNYQSLRTVHDIPKGEISIWEFKVWITTRSCYFFGVISNRNNNPDIFNKTVDQQVFLDTYGIDDKENYIYYGSNKRRQKCEWYKPKIPTKKESIIKIIADYHDKKQLKLTYYFNNKKMGKINDKYTFILPETNDDDIKWYPACSLYNQKAWCTISFPVQTQVFD